MDIAVAATIVAGVVIACIQSSAVALLLTSGLAIISVLYYRSKRIQRSPYRSIDAVLEEYKLLLEIVENSPMPFAVYNKEDRLIAWNRAYEQIHATAFAKLEGKAKERQIHYTDLLKVVADQTLPPSERAGYVQRRAEEQRNAQGLPVDRYYPDFGWKRVTKFTTPGGAVAGFAIDINELKDREKALEDQIGHSQALEEKLRVLANTDSLTRLSNRRFFLEHAEAEFCRAKRYGTKFSVVEMDIDKFKNINDSFGHAIGDDVIVGIATSASLQLRDHVDLMGRLGGEEFAILLPEIDIKGATQCAQRIRRKIEQLEFQAGDSTFSVTASFGAAEVNSMDDSMSALMNRADEALYKAKGMGRNQVIQSAP